jgi:hypothetical protein
MKKKSVSNSFTILAISVIVGIGLVPVISATFANSAGRDCSVLSENVNDLEVQFLIKPGFEGVQYYAAIPVFELAGAKLDPDSNKTRVMIGIRFKSLTIQAAHIEIELLNHETGKVLYQKSFVEEIGPEEVITKGQNLDKVRKWNDYRAKWLDFPIGASKSTAIRIKVKLRSESES